MKRARSNPCTRWLPALCVAALASAACAPPVTCDQPGDICTIAGTGVEGFSGDEGRALEADLYFPLDLTFGPDRLPYILDWNNHRIRKLTADARIVTVAGSGLLGDGPEGDGRESALNHPTHITFDRQGRMVIAAWHNSRIKRMELATGMIEDIAGTGKRAYSGDNGPAKSADFDLPAGVAFDPDGNLMVMDQANQVIRMISPEGRVSRFAGQCLVSACDPGETPVACPGTNKMTCELPSNPESCRLACFPGFGGDDGPADQIRLAQPFGQAADPAGRIAFNAEGELFFADTANHRIRKIDRSRRATTVAGTGVSGTSGEGVPATTAQLNWPTDLDVASDGTVYIADTYNSCVRALQPDGTLHTVAGICGKRGSSGDGGPAEQALLDRPYGVALDDEGNLYIADTYNSRIRMVRR